MRDRDRTFRHSEVDRILFRVGEVDHEVALDGEVAEGLARLDGRKHEDEELNVVVPDGLVVLVERHTVLNATMRLVERGRNSTRVGWVGDSGGSVGQWIGQESDLRG